MFKKREIKGSLRLVSKKSSDELPEDDTLPSDELDLDSLADVRFRQEQRKKSKPLFSEIPTEDTKLSKTRKSDSIKSIEAAMDSQFTSTVQSYEKLNSHDAIMEKYINEKLAIIRYVFYKRLDISLTSPVADLIAPLAQAQIKRTPPTQPLQKQM